MDADFWHSKWEANQIGFHRPDVHPLLIRHWAKLPVRSGDRVFVPLCGKSLDMQWLAEQGHSVVGVEVSPVAAEDFFQACGITPKIVLNERYVTYQSDNITILCGDFFDLVAADLGPVDVVYDRASLVALPEEHRAPYAEQIQRLADTCPTLLITLTYDQSIMQGPPFSVGDAEVRSLFEDRYNIELLEKIDVLHEEPKFAARGLDKLTESIYTLVAS